MKRCLIPVVTVFALAVSLIGCSYDTQAPKHQEETTSKIDKQAVSQKVDNLQVDSFLRQQDINDKISSYPQGLNVAPRLVPELENQVKFLRKQYQQLQEIKYEPESKALDNLMTASLLEQQRMKTAIETNEARIIDGQKELEKGKGATNYYSIQSNIPFWKGQNKVMTEQLEFLTKQYPQFEELRDFLGE